jgi:hypothetical protein
MANEPWNEVAYRFFQNGLSGLISLIVPGSGGAAHVYADQQVVTASAVALTTAGLTNGLTIKAKSTNVGAVFVGPSGVTATDNGTGNGFALLPGEAINLPVSTSAGVFVIGTLNDIVYVIGT